MKVFKDQNGRDWSVAINVAAVKRVRDLLKVDLMAVLDDGGKLIDRLRDDPCLLVDVLFVIVQPQAQAAGISDEQFGSALGGDAIDAATAALLEELVSFFPSLKRRALAKVLQTSRALQERIVDAVVTQLERPELLDEIEARLRAADAPPPPMPGSASGAAPASSASIPAP